MKQTNIQVRKLNVIEKLITLNDEDVFNKVEELIDIYMKRPQVKRFTKQELENRAKVSEGNIENGDVYSQDEIERLSQNW
jgi:hypothetical protein